jgi:hypothetical protein
MQNHNSSMTKLSPTLGEKMLYGPRRTVSIIDAEYWKEWAVNEYRKRNGLVKTSFIKRLIPFLP